MKKVHGFEFIDKTNNQNSNININKNSNKNTSNSHGKRILAVILVLGMMTALLGGCKGKEQKAPVIHLGVMYSSDIIPLGIIEDQKLDEKYGFDLVMQVFSSAKDRDAALQSGELDGIFTDYVAMCIYQNAGLDMKITGVTDGDFQLLAGKDTGITSLQDCAGKSIAISENTLIDYTLDYILEQNGYESDYVSKEIVPRIPDRFEMLRTGKIDLGLMPEPFATLALEEGAVLLGSANGEGIFPAVSAFTQKSIEEKDDTIKAFYQAYGEAVDYINTTPLENFEDIVIKSAGYPEEMKGKIVLPTFRKNTTPSEEELEKAIAWAAGKGLCDAGLKPSDILHIY